MFSTLAVVLPIFALIFAGWLVRRIGVLGPDATSEINRFVVILALPALLFDIIAHAHWAEIWQPGFIATFGLSAVLTFALVVALRLRQPRHLADAAIDGLNAGYGNVGFVGFPLALAALGRDAMAPTLIATILTACVTFAIAIVLIEVGLQSETRRTRLPLRVAGSLARNPLLVAPALGAVVPLAGLAIPAPIETFFKLLGGAASPCALVALGLFLAAERGAGRAGHRRAEHMRARSHRAGVPVRPRCSSGSSSFCSPPSPCFSRPSCACRRYSPTRPCCWQRCRRARDPSCWPNFTIARRTSPARSSSCPPWRLCSRYRAISPSRAEAAPAQRRNAGKRRRQEKVVGSKRLHDASPTPWSSRPYECSDGKPAPPFVRATRSFIMRCLSVRLRDRSGGSGETRDGTRGSSEG